MKYIVILITSFTIALYVVGLDNNKFLLDLDKEKTKYLLESSKVDTNTTFKIELNKTIEHINNTSKELKNNNRSIYIMLLIIFIIAQIYLFILMKTEVKQIK